MLKFQEEVCQTGVNPENKVLLKNAFVLNYRVGNGDELPASLELIAAVEFIRSHAEELEVAPEGYSLWGGSAGARMCSDTSYGEGGIRRLKGLLIS